MPGLIAVVEFQKYRAVDLDSGLVLVDALNPVYVRNYMRGYKKPWAIEQLCQTAEGVKFWADVSAEHA